MSKEMYTVLSTLIKKIENGEKPTATSSTVTEKDRQTLQDIGLWIEEDSGTWTIYLPSDISENYEPHSIILLNILKKNYLFGKLGLHVIFHFHSTDGGMIIFARGYGVEEKSIISSHALFTMKHKDRYIKGEIKMLFGAIFRGISKLSIESLIDINNRLNKIRGTAYKLPTPETQKENHK